MSKGRDEIEYLKELHYEVFHMLDKKEYNKLNRKMKDIRFMHDPNKSKMILTLTQSLVNFEPILEERYLLYKWFMDDCGLVYYDMPLFKNKDNNVPDKYKTNDTPTTH